MQRTLLVGLGVFFVGCFGDVPTCPESTCDCPSSMVAVPASAEVASFLSSLEDDATGMLVSNVAPIEFWSDPATNATLLPSLGDRIKLAWGLDMVSLGAMMVAQSWVFNFDSMTRMIDILTLLNNNMNHTRLRGNGGAFFYGEKSLTQDHETSGYLFRWLSSRSTSADPSAYTQGDCPGGITTCPQFEFNMTTSKLPQAVPSLAASVWSAMIGPLQRDWNYYLLKQQTGIPIGGVDSLQLIGYFLGAMEASRATVGGIYEYPVMVPQTDAESPLEVLVESNLLLKAGISMALELMSYVSGSVAMKSRLEKVLDNVSSFIDGSKMRLQNDTGSLAFDGKEGVFRTSMTVENPRTAPEDVVLTEGANWDPSTQLTAIALLGTQIDEMYSQRPNAAYYIWSKVRTSYGVYSDSRLVGVSATLKGDIMDSLLTVKAVQAGRRLAKSYTLIGNLSIASSIGKDTESMVGNTTARGGYTGFGCAVRGNVAPIVGTFLGLRTAVNNNGTFFEADQRYGFLSDLNTVAMGPTSWAQLGADGTPFVLPEIPAPPTPHIPHSPSSGGIGVGQTALAVGGAFIGALAIYAVVNKALYARKRRANYAQIMQASESRNVRGGEDLGFF